MEGSLERGIFVKERYKEKELRLIGLGRIKGMKGMSNNRTRNIE
jgi:hypothetical protein